MKSVIKKQTHYNLLLMRDDAEAKRYRVHSRVLRFFIWCFLLLVAGGAAGIAGGIHYWEKYRDLVTRYETQERDISEMKLQLERLIALETVISASNGPIPQARHTEIGIEPAYVPAHADTVAQPPADTLVAQNAPTSPDPEARGNDMEAQAAQPPSASDATTPDNGAQAREPDYPLISSMESPVRVAGLSSRATGPQRLSIRYELLTEGNVEQRTISGNVRYFAVFSDGTRLEMPVAGGDSSRFSIARMRSMQHSFRVPDGNSVNDVEKLDVLIELSDGKKFEERFGVSSSE